MIKLLQHVRDWAASPDAGGSATAVLRAWQSAEAKKADVSAPDAANTREFLAEHLVEAASLHECHLRESAKMAHVISRLRDNLGANECHT